MIARAVARRDMNVAVSESTQLWMMLAWIAVGVALDDVAGWGALLAEALRETGGALSDSERAWADEVLGTGGRSAA